MLLSLSFPTTSAPQSLAMLPLTERPDEDEPPSPPPPLPPYPLPPPPPAAVAVESAVARMRLALSWTGPKPSVWEGLSIEARTRITLHIAPRGTRQLVLKLTDGFRVGALVVVNPGGATEERATVLSAAPSLLVLSSGLASTHGVGETVVQLAPAKALEEAASAACWPPCGPGQRPADGPAQQPAVSTAATAAIATAEEMDGSAVTTPTRAQRLQLRLASAAAARYPQLYAERPPAPPPAREAPLLGSLGQLSAGGERYVRVHVGVEAAAALLACALLVLCAVGCIVHAFLEYTLCCFSRGPRKERMIRPARGAGSKPTTPRARELWRDGDERPAFGM